MRKNNRGFTLVELIIVIAILAIIMLIAIPNFSGIQQRMQVRADKATSAQIGKAVRIWYTEYQSDPSFKATVGTTVGSNTADGFLPGPGANMIQIAYVKDLDGYVDSTLVPTSLRTDSGTSEETQRYLVGLTGAGTSEKIIIGIATTDGTTGASTVAIAANGSNGAPAYSQSDVRYDGKYVANYTDNTELGLADLEP